jgi:hypothetical protein
LLSHSALLLCCGNHCGITNISTLVSSIIPSASSWSAIASHFLATALSPKIQIFFQTSNVIFSFKWLSDAWINFEAVAFFAILAMLLLMLFLPSKYLLKSSKKSLKSFAASGLAFTTSFFLGHCFFFLAVVTVFFSHHELFLADLLSFS